MSQTDADNLPPASLTRKALLALVDASQTINGELELTEVFNKITEQAAAVFHAEGASVLLFDADRDELVFQTALGPAGGLLEGERIKADQGIAGQVARTGRAVRVDDVRTNRHFFPGIDAKTNVQTHGLMAAPLLRRGQLLGVVEVLNPQDRPNFEEADLELLKVFANLAAAAASNAKAFDQLSRENRGLRESIRSQKMVGESRAIKHVLELCEKVAQTNATVLILGETGTGKELIARTVHDLSDRRDKPFIAVNCAALAESLLESELFGHEKGAFTGASDRKLGRFELAEGGTLFLDELAEMDLATQVKLLRVLQEREFVRVGGTQTLTCDVRIVTATNRDLKKEIDAGRFRSDLFYRVNVFPIHAPPLRDRVEDLPMLVEHFTREVVPSLNVAPLKVNDAAMSCMMSYDWPGNIRELRNVVERAALLAGEQITPEHLPPEIGGPRRDGLGSAGSAGGVTGSVAGGTAAGPSEGGSKLAEHERTLIRKALEETGWNQSAAARQLGISRDNLRYRLKKYGLTKPGTA
jgi:Nif-specific regulatory protein